MWNLKKIIQNLIYQIKKQMNFFLYKGFIAMKNISERNVNIVVDLRNE